MGRPRRPRYQRGRRGIEQRKQWLEQLDLLLLSGIRFERQGYFERTSSNDKHSFLGTQVPRKSRSHNV
jgi:hypothetical protein